MKLYMISTQMSFNLYKDIRPQVEVFTDFKDRAVSCKFKLGTSTSLHGEEAS